MPADVIINPTSGEIYWNDGTGSTQSISIRGDSQNKIDIIGYSAGFSPGSSGIGTFTIATFNDNAGTAAFAPGTTGNELGSSVLRWKPFLTTTNISDNAATLGTNSVSLTTGLVQVNGGIAISGSASVGGTLLLFASTGQSFYVGLRAAAGHATTTVYSFPTAFPSTGTSVLSSNTSGTLSWVAMAASGTTAANINTAAATTGILYPLMANSTTTTGIGASYDVDFTFDSANNVLFADGLALTGSAVTTTSTTFALVNDTATSISFGGAATALTIGNVANTATIINFSPTGTGQKEFNFGTASASASTATFFGSVNSNRMILNVNSSGNVYIQTNQVNARVRLFQNNTTGNVSIFGIGGGTLYLGEDSTTNNSDIALRGTVLAGGGGSVRAGILTISTATSNGSGAGGTILFQTSTSGNATGSQPNTLRTRMRIEGAATGTSVFESVIILGEDASGTAFTSTLRGSDASGSNVNAGELIIQAARSTGTGTMAGICFNVASPGLTGSALNTLIDVGHFYSVQNASSTTLASLVVKGGLGLTGNAIIGGTTFIQSNVSSTGTGIGALVNSGGFGNAGNAFIGGTTTITSNTSSTGTAAGSLVNAGGFGNAGNAFIGGTTTITSNTSSTGTAAGSLVNVGGFGNAGNAFIGGTTTITSNTSSTGTAAGSLVNAGGFGNAGNAFIGGTTTITNNTSSTGTASGSLVNTGGFGNAGNAFIGGTVTITNNTISGSVTSGSLVVAGGAGFGGSVTVAGTLRVGSNTFTRTFSSGDVTLDNGSAVDTPGITYYWGNLTNYGTDVYSDGVGSTRYRVVYNLNESGGREVFSVDLNGVMRLNNSTSYVGFRNSGTATTTYTLPPNSPQSALGTSVLSSTIDGTMTWVGMGGGGSGTVNSGTAGSAAYYPGNGSAVSGSADLYIASGVGITVNPNTSSTSTSSGALVNKGGFGNAGNAFIGGTTTITNNTSSTGTASGSLVNTGGFGNAGNAFIGGTVTLTNTTGSGNTTSGSLVLAGGAGIAGSVNIGGILGVGGTLDYSATGLLGYFAGSVNSYTQVIVHNHSSGNSASSDFIVSNDASTDTGTYGDFGINSSGWASTTSPFNTANASYLTATNGDLVLGTTTANALRIGIGGSIFDVVHIPSTGTGFTIVPTTSATGLSSGSLVVRGGFGLVGNAFIGGTATHLDTTSSTGVAAGSLVNAGGFGNAGNAFIGGTTTITSTTSAIGVSGGALVVFGSVGIGRSINIVGGANFWNSTNTFYSGIQGGAATSNISYTLPPGPPSGVGVSILSSTSTGVMSWIPQSSGSATADSVKVYDATGASFLITMAPTNTGAGTSIFANSNFTFNATTSTLISGFTFAVTSGNAISNTTYNSSAGFSFTPTSESASTFVVNNSGGGTVFAVDASVGATNVRINRTGSLRLYNSANTFYTSIRGGAATSNIDYTLPIGPPSGAGTSVLSSTSTGVLSWIAQGSGSATPGDGDTAVQFNDGGSAFGGTNVGFAFAKSTHTVTIGSTNQTGHTSKGLLLYNNNASDLTNTQRWSPALEYMGRSYTPTGAIDYRVRFLSEVQTLTTTYGQRLTWRFSYDTGTASYTNNIFVLHSQNGVGVGATDATAINYLKTSSAQSVDQTYVFPTAYPTGTATSFLSASTTGVMAWVAPPAGSGSPGGSNKQIQYNNSSTFGGAAGFEYITGGSAVTVSMFSSAGTGYTAGLWVHAINGATTRVGIGLSNPAFELEINGELSATNKSFVIDHPTKPGMKLRYGSLEGPENGVYVRGILNNENIIYTPEHWTGLVDPNTFTITLTPIGRFAQLYVEKVEDYTVYVADNQMNPIHCYYTVWAERKDIPKLVTEY